MISVVRIYLLYVRTVLILTADPASQYMNANKQHVHGKFHILSQEANSWRLKSISCNRNEPKQCINTWQITEVPNSTKRHADNGGNHLDL